MLPPEINSICPSSIAVQKEDCKAAGQALGGLLHDGNIVEGSWTNRPSGCSFGPVIQYNANPNGKIINSENIALNKPTSQSSPRNDGGYVENVALGMPTKQSSIENGGLLVLNVARGKPTSQSSTGYGGVSARAVDGNRS